MAGSSPLAHLRAACATLEPAVRADARVPQATLDATRPRGRPARSWQAWLGYYTMLTRWHAAGGSAGAGNAGAAQPISVDDALVFDALRSHPRAVQLTLGPDGERRTVTVYPKSAHTLFELHKRNLLIAHYAAAADELTLSADPAHLELVLRAVAEVDYQHHVCAWVLTTGGVGQPFGGETERPDLPEYVTALTPLDLEAIAAAGLMVHARRLQSLDALLAADPVDGAPPRRPSWSQFFSALAVDPADAERLLRDVALPSLLAAVRLGGDAKLAAHQDADRRAHERAGSE